MKHNFTNRKMRFLAALIALVTVLTSFAVYPVTVTAETPAAWDGSTKTEPAGAGTEADPYQIANGENLAWMSDFVPKNQNPAEPIYYLQTADIDLGGHNFESIGWQFATSYIASWGTHGAAAFYGVYDGGNFKISNAVVVCKKPNHGLTPKPSWEIDKGYNGGQMTINTMGLFGAVHEGTIKNVNLVNVDVGTYNPEGADIDAVYSTGHTGVLVGAGRNLTVENCTVDETSSAYGGWFAGGIVGFVYGTATIRNCTNKATVISDISAGGIVGSGYGLDISYCINDGDIMVDNRGHAEAAKMYVGGICGSIYNSDKAALLEKFMYCLNGENASLTFKTNRASGFKARQGGILGDEVRSDHTFIISHCLSLMTTPVKGIRAAGDSSTVRQGTMIGQVAAAADKATMEYCAAVNVNRMLFEGTIGEDSAALANEDIQLNTNYPLNGLVSGHGDGGGTGYWNNEKISTNKYGATAAEIKASDDYKKIVGEISDDKPFRPDTTGHAAVYVGCQETAVENGKYDVRLIATVDSTEHKTVGFKITVKGTDLSITDRPYVSKTFYHTLTAKGENEIISYEPATHGGKYYITLTLRELTLDNGTVTIQVTPYWMDGSTIQYGASCTAVYENGIFVSHTW